MLSRVCSDAPRGERSRLFGNVCITALAACAFLAAGCSGGPSMNQMFDMSAEAEGTGIMGAGLVRAVVILAKYKATEQQRHIAEQNARRAYARMVANVSDRHAVQTSPTPKPEHRARPIPAGTTAEKRKKAPRYIAVDTKPDERSQGSRSVMIWDTQSQEVVGNDVYDIKSPPPLNNVAKFETFSAEYVGSGIN